MIRSLIARGIAALALLSCAMSSPAMAVNLSVKDGAGTTQTICAASQSDSSLGYCFVYHDSTGAQVDLATKAQMLLLTNANGSPADPYSVATDVSPASEIALLKGIIKTLGASPAQAGGKIDTVVSSASTDIGANVAATTATTLVAANATRRGFSVQNQTAGACYFNGLTAPTGTYHDMVIASGALYESKDSHVGTGALQVYCAQAGGVYARQW